MEPAPDSDGAAGAAGSGAVRVGQCRGLVVEEPAGREVDGGGTAQEQQEWSKQCGYLLPVLGVQVSGRPGDWRSSITGCAASIVSIHDKLCRCRVI